MNLVWLCIHAAVHVWLHNSYIFASIHIFTCLHFKLPFMLVAGLGGSREAVSHRARSQKRDNRGRKQIIMIANVWRE